MVEAIHWKLQRMQSSSSGAADPHIVDAQVKEVERMSPFRQKNQWILNSELLASQEQEEPQLSQQEVQPAMVAYQSNG